MLVVLLVNDADLRKTTPHQKGPELSKEVHRIGFHFPSNVVAEICNKYGITLTKAGTVVGEEYEQSVSRLRRRGKKESVDDSDQVTINTKAKDAIQDLFPNIPERDLFLIIKTAFQKGQKKVGTANELSLVRRAQLSVVAHIRHIYTEYDRLLRKVGYHEARSRVEAATLKKLVEWRGDDESGKKVFEDVMKEVIVLPDDEGSDDDSEAAEYLETQNVQHSFERPQVLTRAVSPRDLEYPELLDNDGFQYVPQVPSRKRDTARDHTDEVQYRHDAWERARREFRENPVALKPIIDFDEWADNHPDHENLYLRDQFSYRKAPSVPTGVYLYRDPSTSVSWTVIRILFCWKTVMRLSILEADLHRFPKPRTELSPNSYVEKMGTFTSDSSHTLFPMKQPSLECVERHHPETFHQILLVTDTIPCPLKMVLASGYKVSLHCCAMAIIRSCSPLRDLPCHPIRFVACRTVNTRVPWANCKSCHQVILLSDIQSTEPMATPCNCLESAN